MSIETAIYNVVNPLLQALSPALSLYWGVVPSTVQEYVSLSQVSDSMDNLDDFTSEHKQFNIVMRNTVSGAGPMTRAAAVRDLLKTHLIRMKGVFSGVAIQNVSYVRSVELPNPSSGEMIIVSEYQINYQGVI